MKPEHKSERKVKRKTTAARDFKEEPKSQLSSQSSATSNHNSTPKQMDVLTATVNSQKREEDEAINRSADHDFVIFSKVCEDIRTKLRQIKQLKDNDSQEDIKVCKQEICMLFLELRKLNRLDKLRCKHARDLVSDAKSKVDFKHLQQQNLLYEAMYLQKEISKCLEFKSKDEEIDLISVEKFYEKAPDELRKSDLGNDPHQLQLARLQWELMDRKNLAKSLEEKTRMKEKITQAIMVQKRCLGNLKPMLNGVVEACQPLHQELNLPLQATDIRHANAKFLPKSLYILYVNVCAAKEACGFKYDVEIDGNVEEAKSRRDDILIEEDDAVDSDAEDRKGKRHRKSLTDKKDAFLRKLTSTHPLFVILTFSDEESKTKLRIEFYYLTTLRIICIKTKVSSNEELKHMDILDDSVMHFLEPDDDGLTSPNPGNAYYLQLHGFRDFKQLVPKIGYAYRWAQKLCGLYFLPSSDTSASSHIEHRTDEIVSMVDKTLRTIVKRLRSRILLDQQFLDLEKGMLSLPSHILKNTFQKISCTIKEWSQITEEEFNKHQSAEEIRNIGIIDPHSFLYKLVIERGSAQLNANVAISSAYPEKSPVFLLSLNWQFEKTSRNNLHLRDLEELTNVICVEQTEERNKILLFQVHTLCVGFDVLLETDEISSGVEGPLEFPKGRIFARLTSGRNHSKPFRYCPEYGFFTT